MARVGLDGEMRAAERLGAEVALGARILAQSARLEAAAVEVALAARVLPHVSAEHLERVRAWVGFGQRVYCWVADTPGVGVADTEPHLLPKVVRRAARAKQAWLGSGLGLKLRLGIGPGLGLGLGLGSGLGLGCGARAAAAKGGRGARRALQPGLPLARKRGARVAVDRAVVEEEQAAHHDTTPPGLHSLPVSR